MGLRKKTIASTEAPATMFPSLLALRMLLWKNFKTKQRRPISTLVEILLPTLFFYVLVYARRWVRVVGVGWRRVCRWDSPCTCAVCEIESTPFFVYPSSSPNHSQIIATFAYEIIIPAVTSVKFNSRRSLLFASCPFPSPLAEQQDPPVCDRNVRSSAPRRRQPRIVVVRMGFVQPHDNVQGIRSQL